MKIILPMFFCALLIACGAPIQPPTPLPTITPLALAQTTTAPIPTHAPNASSAPTATFTAVSPTTLPTPSAFPTRAAPTILASFKLLDLPGEGRAPNALALVGERIYVANRDSNNIGEIRQDRVQSFISLEANPNALVPDPAHNRIYAAYYETPTLTLIENDRVVKNVTVGGRVNALALDRNDLFVALDNDAIIERYDASTLTKQAQLKLSDGFGVSDVIADAPRNRLYAAVYGKIFAVDLSSFRELFMLDAPYLYSKFAVNPNDGSIWAGAYDEKTLRAYVIGYSTDGKEIARTYVGSDLRAAAFDDANRLYVLDRFRNQVYVLQTPRAGVLATIGVNEAPSAALFDPARKIVLVTNEDSDNVSVIDAVTSKLVNTIPLANRITALAANPAGQRVYATNAANNTLYAIEGIKIVAQAPTGPNPVDLAFDSEAHRLYVANSGDGTLTVVDEKTFEIVATQFVTNFLSTVAVDSLNVKLFAGSAILDPQTFAQQDTFFARGLTLNSQTSAQYERANPVLKKLYAVASNGVPGSNARVTLYRFDYSNFGESKMLGSKNGGNTSALAIDPSTNNVYAANTHPLAYTHGLDVFDAQDNLVQSLALGSHTPALAVNPTTHHLFLAHAQTYQPYPREPRPRDDTIEILDTRTLGTVATLDVPGDPWRMTVVNDQVYAASYADGKVTIIGDAEVPPPPAPTPTSTPTLYPTWTFTPPSATARAATPSATPHVVVDCVNAAPVQFVPFQDKVAEVGSAELGCVRAAPLESNQFAYQPLERGFMIDDYRDGNAKKVYVFFPDGTYKIFADTFREDQEDKICDVPVARGLWRPKRGFGTVWCKEDEVQALGGGLVEEHSVRLTQQQFGNATFWFVPDRGVVIVWNDGKWQ